MSTAVTATPDAGPPKVTGALDEFSDKLSPMLVKELRQGLRAKTFVILFLALQALLCVVLLSAVGATSGSGDSGRSVSSVIFFFFSLAALVVQPLRGVGALHNEIKGQTIDLMVLTRLGAWRIVLGKWVAIVSQTALLLVAIAPYLILRYFFGRMNLFAELNLLALVFLGSAAFTAVTVGLSAIPSILVRGLLPLFLAIYMGGGIFAITFGNDVEDAIKFCSLQNKEEFWALLTGIAVGVYFAWNALALGASMIAPMAENHSTVRRLVALLALCVIGGVIHYSKFPREGAGMLLVLFAAPAAVIALTEVLQLLPPICRPFLRFGTAGRIAGRFLYPGWPSGVLFAGLLIAVSTGIFLASSPASSIMYGDMVARMHTLLLAGVGTLILSALILRFLAKRVNQPFAVYQLVFFGLVAIAIGLALIAGETTNDSFLWLFSWIPPVQVPLIDWVGREHRMAVDVARELGQPVPAGPDYGPVVTTGIVTCSLYYFALLICAIRSFPAIRAVEDEVTRKPADES